MSDEISRILERHPAAMAAYRAATIEECAQVAETYPEWAAGDRAAKIAAAIRALKEK